MFMKTGLLTISTSCLAAFLLTGCVERRVVYVPAYQAPPPGAGAPVYTYQTQTAYQTPPAQPADGTAATVAPPAEPQPAPPPNTVVAQAPPAAQVEVVPVSPGPVYAWVPGYWSIGVGGGWIWVGGHYAFRPRPHAIWVNGYWTRHGHGYLGSADTGAEKNPKLEGRIPEPGLLQLACFSAFGLLSAFGFRAPAHFCNTL
jgi:hypothetical protein